MRSVGRLLAVLVIISFFVPWFEVSIKVHQDVFERGYSFSSIVHDAFNGISGHLENVTSFSHVMYVIGMYSNFGDKEMEVYAIGLLISIILVSLGAGVAIVTGSRVGHFLGLLGMAVFTYATYPFVENSRGILEFSIGYVVAWLGFFGGVLLGGSVFEKNNQLKKSS